MFQYAECYLGLQLLMTIGNLQVAILRHVPKDNQSVEFAIRRAYSVA